MNNFSKLDCRRRKEQVGVGAARHTCVHQRRTASLPGCTGSARLTADRIIKCNLKPL
jgi:hypothetical protein